MRKTVQIIGTCPLNIKKTPAKIEGVERWCANDPAAYTKIGFQEALSTWTRWFNVHRPKHIALRHPNFTRWAQKHDGTRPIYTLEADPTIPGNRVFPGPHLQAFFGLSNGERESFFTHQCAWLMALAIEEEFEVIELWGFQFGAGSKPSETVARKYAFERPAMHYWIGRARQAGIFVKLPPEAKLCHTDFLYGYDGPAL